MRRTAAKLDRGLAGQQITVSDFRVPQLAVASLAGERVIGCTAYGKHLFIRVDGGATLHSHLRMDGSWVVVGPGRRPPPRVDRDLRVVLRVADGTTAYGVHLHDLGLVPTAEEDRLIGHLGPDILAEDFDARQAEWLARLGTEARRPVVEALLDQRNLAGIGNLWAGETLFLRGVSPWTPVSEVDLAGAVRLARRMMRYSLRHSGQVTTGNTRQGQEHWVYGRAGRPCRRCGTLVQLRHATGVDERETWWCPHCQPGPVPPG